MRLVVTGGGTGGHVFPALEVARLAKSEHHDVLYMGSLRGQEKGACGKAGIAFIGFPSQPLYNLKTPRGMKAAANMMRSVLAARVALGRSRPHVVFSTGGYSSAPVVTAAKWMKIPYVVHEQNSVPGRSNLLVAQKAFAVATTFRTAAQHFDGCRVVRTGLPVRQELREIAGTHKLDIDADPLTVLVVGGSQGASTINESAIATAARMIKRPLRWIHVTGKQHFETLFPTYEKLGIGNIYEMKSFLDGAAMGEAYARASVVVGRSGAGTLSELAAFLLPSVLIPYPSAHAQHQLHNAKEFEAMGAASIIEQDSLHPSSLEAALLNWMEHAECRERAQSALEEWDEPDAARMILNLVKEAGDRKS